MKRLAFLLCALLGIAFFAPGASAATIAEENGWKPILTAIPRFVDMRSVKNGAKSGRTIPTFTSSVKSPVDGKTYSFTIVGSDPTKTPASTTIEYVPIALRWHFPGGIVIDPTKPGCNDTVPVVSRLFDGPLFTSVPNTSNGVTLPKTQTTDAFQIAEFYQYTKNTGYHVLLSSFQKGVTVIDVTAPSGSTVSPGPCGGAGHDIGKIDINSYDSLINTLILKHTKSSSVLPLLMSYNVLETAGGCCIVGYHSVLTHGGEPQPYATAAYIDANVFSPLQDIGAWQNVLGDLFNDPYTINETPSWFYDETGCRVGLYVSVPRGLAVYKLKENGFTYHPTELAFFSWFFGQMPSLGTGGEYSYKGSFTSQGVCR